MKNVRAVKHSVLAFFVNPPGEGKTKGGIITLDDDGDASGIKTRFFEVHSVGNDNVVTCLLYTSPSPRDVEESRMPSSA